jgi:large subunit ribosomal protein L44
MNHVQKRLVSNAAKIASISPSTVATFPPKESFKPEKGEFVKSDFNPENWAHLQPAPSTALSAFAHRIGLASIFPSTDVIRQVCTHPSFLPLFRQHYPSKPEPKTNSQLATLGNSLMGLFAAEYIQAKYPLPPHSCNEGSRHCTCWSSKL